MCIIWLQDIQSDKLQKHKVESISNYEYHPIIEYKEKITI